MKTSLSILVALVLGATLVSLGSIPVILRSLALGDEPLSEDDKVTR
jgi:hypothetical protein